MTRVIWLTLLLASSAFAQLPGFPTRASSSSSAGSDCRALDGGVCETTASMTLYVDPTGSDSNACTASGTSACATLTGALAKLPRNINHAVTINMAAGTYTENPSIGPFTFGTTGGAAGTLTIQGDWTQFTPSTGATTGTVTSYTAGTNGVPPTWTDSSQSWTAGDLKGVFFRMTSGGFSGQVRAAITDNTATTVTMTANMASLTGAYELVVPAVTIVGTVSVSGIYGVGSATGSVALHYLNITGSSASGSLVISNVDTFGPGASSGVFLRQIRVFNSALGGLTCAVRKAKVAVSSGGAYFESSALSGLGVALYLSDDSVGSFYGYARALGSGRAIVLRNSTLSATSQGYFATAEAPSALYEVVQLYGETAPSGLFVANFVVRGNAAATGIRLGSTPLTASAGFPAQLTGYAAVSNQNLRVETALTALRADTRSIINLVGTVPSFTGVTNELSIDGTAYTYSFLSGLTCRWSSRRVR